MRYLAILAISLAGATMLAGPAQAHITLEVPEAPIGGAYKAVLRVPHGCDGSATIALRVEIPPGFLEVKPQPKPGWRIAIVTGPYDRPYDQNGAKLTQGVREIAWSGGDLPDAYYDEFALRGIVSTALKVGAMLYFPVVQECASGVERWIEIPADGKKADDYEHPAPGVRLVPGAGDDD